MSPETDIQRSTQAASRPAAPLRIALWAALVALLAGGVYLWAVRGNAVLLDLATGVKGLLCL